MSEASVGTVAASVTDLQVRFGARQVLDGINFRIADGEALALLGANGSGKTTLVKAMLGLVPHTAGHVALFGRDITQRRSVSWPRIGYVPQRVNASPATAVTAAEVVASGLLNNWSLVPGRHGRRRVLNALDQVGLQHRARESVHIFSGGQQQRVLLARALVRRPDLLILDEPLSGIDLESQNALMAALQQLQDGGASIVAVLHEPGVLAPLIRRAVVLEHGRAVYDGALSAVRPGAGLPVCRGGQL